MPEILHHKSGAKLFKRTPGEKRKKEIQVSREAETKRLASMSRGFEEELKTTRKELALARAELLSVREGLRVQRELLLNMVEAQSKASRLKINEELLAVVNKMG
jgi:hypothetical protein